MDAASNSVFLLLILFVAAVVIIIFYLKSPGGKGRRGESNIESIILRKLDDKLYGEVLRNLFLPKADGGTSEVDVLLVCNKGIFVFESKNFAGWIFGDDEHKYWTVSLYAGRNWLGFKRTEKYKFYNPIWQNNSHIRNLRRVLGDKIPITSIIVFSDRSEFKSVTNNSDAIIMHTSELKRYLSRIKSSYTDVLTADQVQNIYNQLLNYKDVDGEKKSSHIAYVTGQLQNPTICPRCGGKLVLRTAKKGEHVGEQFYGCSNFPKCRFTRKI